MLSKPIEEYLAIDRYRANRPGWSVISVKQIIDMHHVVAYSHGASSIDQRALRHFSAYVNRWHCFRNLLLIPAQIEGRGVRIA
jgi:hypothetical protein